MFINIYMFLWVLEIIVVVYYYYNYFSYCNNNIYVALANKRMNTLKNVILFQLDMFEIIYMYRRELEKAS